MNIQIDFTILNFQFFQCADHVNTQQKLKVSFTCSFYRTFWSFKLVFWSFDCDCFRNKRLLGREASRSERVSTRKNTLNSQSAFWTLSAVYILYPICTLHSAFCTNRHPWHQYSLFLVTVIRTTHSIYHKIPVYELLQHFSSFPS